MKDQSDLFTGREDAIRIFQQLYQHDKEDCWPLLPILSLVGPAGYGKSALIDRLHFYHCNTPHQPHTTLNFNEEPHDLFTILGTLRNNLQRQRDEHGYVLKFPRFTILYNLLKRTEGQKEIYDDDLDGFDGLLNDYSDLMGLVGNLHFMLGVFMFVLKLMIRVPLIRSFVRWLVAWWYERAKGKPEWRWYQDQVKKFREINLPPNASISNITNRLYEMCVLGRSERDFLITQILSKAFLADLRYGSYDQEPWLRDEPEKRQQGPHRVVIFLDRFDLLMRNAESTAKHLLEVLALNEYRKRGDTDPLLLVISSEERLPDMSREQLNQHFPLITWPIQQRTGNLLKWWQQHVPPPDQRHALQLQDIYLPLPLSPFTLQNTREYLLKLDQHNETQSFTEEALIEDIQRETQGNLLYLEQVAASLQTPQRKGVNIRSSTKLHQPSVLTIDRLFAASGQRDHQENMERLLRQYCLLIDERELMLSAIPRALTPDLLGLIHNISFSNELEDEWQRYRRLPFMLSGADKRKHHMVFLPDVRRLFLKKLQRVSADSTNTDYNRIHSLLRDYFDDRIKRSIRDSGKSNERSRLEYSYHSLALGEYEPVIALAYNQRHIPEHWEHLLDVVKQAPVERLVHADVRRLAEEALVRVRLSKDTQEAVRAIVLYTWLLSAPGSDYSYVASLWHSLGMAYNYLQDAHRDVREGMVKQCDQHIKDLRDGPRIVVVPPDPIEPPPPIVVPDIPLTVRVRRFSRDLLRGGLASRTVQGVLLLALIFFVVTQLIILPVLKQHSVINNIAGPISVSQLPPSSKTHWIGTMSEPDQEIVGLSDGTTPFDAQRPDSALKKQAALQWRNGNLSAARGLLQQAWKGDVNDAEALIYLQNAQILLSRKSCIVFVVVTTIVVDATEGVNNGRDNLQGAYLAQKEHNNNQPEKPICLYVANIGTNPDYASAVAQQIIKAVAANNMIKGLIGWPGLFDSPASLNAVHLLQAAQIPIVSPDSYNESAFVPNVFHVAPSYQDEGRKAALYAENKDKSKAVVITDPTNAYSRYLTEGFKERFEEDGKQIVSVKTYTSGQTDANVLVAELQSALTTHPDFIYFAGDTKEGLILLNYLREKAPTLQMLGGDELYPLIGFSTQSRRDFNQLVLTSPAYPDTSTATSMVHLYASLFDGQGTAHGLGYGYSRPDYRVILSYDAMSALINVYIDSLGLGSIQQELPSFIAKGASRAQIEFTSFNELKDQNLFLLSVDNKDNVTSNII